MGNSFVLDAGEIVASGDDDDDAPAKPKRITHGGGATVNLLQELRALDPRDPGRWPLAVRAGAVAVCFVVVALLAGYFFVWTDLNPQLQQLQDQEQPAAPANSTTSTPRPPTWTSTSSSWRTSRSPSVPCCASCPSKTEVDNLLVDISQTGLAAALDQKLFQPESEVEEGLLRRAPDQDPLRRQLSPVWRLRQRHRGAAAHRHAARRADHAGATSARSRRGIDQLQMDLTAKTYRYLDDEEVATAEADRRKADKAAKRPTG